MIDKILLRQCVERALEGTDGFIVDLTVKPDNIITVEIDSQTSVDIDTCVRVTRAVEAEFDRDVEDYELEVGSAGLTAPFKVKEQYLKNIGNPVDILTRDGRKIHGVLTAVADDGSDYTVTTTVKVKEPGKKRPVMVEQPETIAVADTKEIRYRIEFK